MKNNLFDKLYNKIILEEDLIVTSPIIYNNLSLAIIPGSFKPPYKETWKMIMNYLKVASDKLIVIISNISKSAISNRPLSKTNLTRFIDIINDIEEETSIDFSNYKNELLNQIDTLSYKSLKLYCKNTIYPLLDDNEELIERCDKYLKSLKKTLFKNIKYTELGTDITAETALKIFQIYASTYNVTNKIEFRISEFESPFNDMINIIKNECNNCDIYLSLNKENEETANSQYTSLLMDLNKDLYDNNKQNNLIEYPIIVNSDISEDYIRKNITDLKREWFPDKISDIDFNIIKDLLIK